MGLYLQDTRHHSDGLAVVKGSHARDVLADSPVKRVRRTALRWLGSPNMRLVSTSPGDLVIWDFRILHSGEVVRLRPAPRLPVPLNLQGRIPQALALPPERRRVVMFPTFGLESPDLDSWLERQRTREYMKRIWARSEFPDSVVDEALAAGVKILRPVPEFGMARAAA